MHFEDGNFQVSKNFETVESNDRFGEYCFA